MNAKSHSLPLQTGSSSVHMMTPGVISTGCPPLPPSLPRKGPDISSTQHTCTHKHSHLLSYHCNAKTPYICTDCVALSRSRGINTFGLQQERRKGRREGGSPISPVMPHPDPPTPLSHTLLPTPLTAMYGRQPISFVFAMESMSCPVSPKSHSFMAPPRFITTFEGLMSKGRGEGREGSGGMDTHTSTRHFQ